MNIVLALVAVACAFAAFVWGRSARLRYGLIDRIEEDVKALANSQDSFVALQLARLTFRKEIHTMVLYIVLAIAFGAWAVSNPSSDGVPLLAVLVAVPAVVSKVKPPSPDSKSSLRGSRPGRSWRDRPASSAR